jgi:hypothetical protein
MAITKNGKKSHEIALEVLQRHTLRVPFDVSLRSLGNGRQIEKLRHHRYPRRAHRYMVAKEAA